jgi:hypothetical protein
MRCEKLWMRKAFLIAVLNGCGAGYIYYLSATSVGAGATKMELPKGDKPCTLAHPLVSISDLLTNVSVLLRIISVGLIQPYLVLQLYLESNQPFSASLTFRDAKKAKRRLVLSSAFRSVTTSPLHAQLPTALIRRDVWLNLVIDVKSLVHDCFDGASLSCVDAITIGAVAKVRKVYTLRNSPIDTSEDEKLLQSVPPATPSSSSARSGAASPDSHTPGAIPLASALTEPIPRTHDFPPGVDFLTQLFTLDKVTRFEQLSKTAPIAPPQPLLPPPALQQSSASSAASAGPANAGPSGASSAALNASAAMNGVGSGTLSVPAIAGALSASGSAAAAAAPVASPKYAFGRRLPSANPRSAKQQNSKENSPEHPSTLKKQVLCTLQTTWEGEGARKLMCEWCVICVLCCRIVCWFEASQRGANRRPPSPHQSAAD